MKKFDSENTSSGPWNWSWKIIFEQIFWLSTCPSHIYKGSANFVFLKEMEMWEWINYFISHLKIQKQSLNKCPESVKSSAFNHFSLFQIPDLRAMESFVSPTVLIVDKILKKILVLNLCFSHLMRWEILGRPKKHFRCTGIWSLWNLAVSLWQF